MLSRVVGGIVFATVAGCGLMLAPDSVLMGGGSHCDLDAGPQQDAGCWQWSATSTDGWSINNSSMLPDGGAGRLDCCGCSPCVSCTDNTLMSAQNGVITFNSGPEMNGGLNHNIDGFTARYDNVPVVPGQAHVLSFDIVGLDASVACYDAQHYMCNNPTAEDMPPKWSVAVFEQGTQLGIVTGTWGTSQCLTCPSGPSDWGPKVVSFTPSTSSVMVVVSAVHGTSQCASEAWGVTLSTDGMSIVAQ